MNVAARNLPRVLVIGAPPMRAAGSTLTMTNLFHAFPASHVAQLHLDAGEPDAERVSRSMRLPGNGSTLERVLRQVVRRQGTSQPSERRITAAGQGGSGSRTRLARDLATALDLLPASLPRGLGRWVRDFDPDIIYTQLGSVRVARLVHLVSSHLDIPVVPHFMDAWPSTLYADGELMGLGRRAVRRSLQAAVSSSPVILAISPEMAAEYSKRLEIRSEVFLNCVDDRDYATTSDTRDAAGPVLRYVGGLHLDRWRLLTKVAQALGRVSPSSTLHVNAPEADLGRYAKEFTALKNVVWGPSLAAHDVGPALHDSDLLVHVEAFGPAARAYTRLSISTKLPQYMASGRPVLGYGPPEIASMRHIERSGCGLVVERDLDMSLISLLDPGTRGALGRCGLAYAQEHHRRAEVSQRFIRTLSDAVDRGRATQ